MKILITGANGFIGSSLVNFLVKENFDVSVLVRKTSNVSSLKEVWDKIKVYYGDVRNKDSLVEPVRNVELIIHCAAVLRCVNNKLYYEINHIGTKNLVEAIIEYNDKIKGIIYFSSQAASGPSKIAEYKKINDEPTPVSHYGKSKLLAEQELSKYSDNIKTIILRPAATYGPYDKDMFIYFKLAEKGLLPVFNNNFYIQFLYIYDLVKIVEKIILNFDKIPASVYFVAEDKCYSIEEIRKIFSSVFNKKIIKFVVPYSLAYIFAFINEEIYKIFYKKPAVFNRDKLKELRQNYWLCHSNEIKKYFSDFEYTSLEEGVKQTYSWYKQNGWL